MIYIIVGKSCSGKTSVKRHLESQEMISFEASKYMKNYISRYNLPPDELFKKFGKDFVSKLIFEDISNLKTKNPIVISGLRTVEEIMFFKDKRDVKIIGLKTSNDICFNRNIERNREDRIKDFSEFLSKRIDYNSKIGLDNIFKNHIDRWITNEGTLEDLKLKLNKILKEDETN